MSISNSETDVQVKGMRSSNIELFRIITMLVIVAHHFVCNSNLGTELFSNSKISVNSLFAVVFGAFGKTGINCFVLITGYFMCKSNITIKKFMKLLLEIEFYRIVIYLLFVAFGVRKFGFTTFIKVLLPVTSIADGFTSAYVMFYLFIPFINILIKGMNKTTHALLVGLCLVTYTILAVIRFKVVFNYVTWFCVIYLIGSYIRLYPEKWFESKKVWGSAAIASVVLSVMSIITICYIKKSVSGLAYFFLSDSNKPLAVITAVCTFMFFKNINIGYSKLINQFGAATFGVLLIHANSDAMRNLLWNDTLNALGQFKTSLFPIYAIVSVVVVFTVCAIIDIIRIHFLERPFFKWFDRYLKIRGENK